METISINERQQGLNEVVINKVQSMIEGKRPGVESAISRLLEEGKISQDFIAPIGVNLRMNDRKPVINFSANGHVQMVMQEGEFSLHDNAVNQIAEKMNIPAKYLRGLAAGDEWQRKLCGNLRLKVMEAAVESFRLIIDKYQLNMPVGTALCGRDIMKDFIDWMAEKCRI